MAGFETLVPSVDAPRHAHVDRFVALLVSARVNVRSTWSDDVEVSNSVFQKLLESEPPPPTLTLHAPIQFKMLDPKSRSATPRNCRSCFATPGRRMCSICGGSGRIGEGDESRACFACAAGSSPCMACDGTGTSRAVTVLFGEDSVRPMAHIFIPNVPPSLRDHLVAFFRGRASVPNVLSVDLSSDFAGADAYRGRQGSDEIHGHRADSVVGQARAYVERLKRLPSVVACEHVAFAWPFAVVAHGEQAVAHVVDERGHQTRLPRGD